MSHLRHQLCETHDTHKKINTIVFLHIYVLIFSQFEFFCMKNFIIAVFMRNFAQNLAKKYNRV